MHKYDDFNIKSSSKVHGTHEMLRQHGIWNIDVQRLTNHVLKQSGKFIEIT